MIEAIYEIGKVVPQKDFLEEYIEDIGKNYKHVFKIVIDISDEDNFKYSGIEYEEFDSDKKMKYFYKKGSSKGTDKTPTSKITEITKTLKTKIFPIFKKIIEDNKKIINESEKLFLEKIDSIIKSNKETIKNDIDNLLEENGFLKSDGSIKDGGIITFIFRKKAQSNYAGDIELFRNLFKNNENEAYRSFYYSKSNKVFSKANNKTCYICKSIADEVWGFVNTYNFYNVDKESYVAGGLQREYAWRNYPVCSTCAKVLERGKKYADENLIYRFCGFNYYLIPQLIIENKESLIGVLERLKKYKNFSLKEDKATIIERVEEKILKELSKEKNFINFNFLFFEKSNNAFKILLNLHEIPPTRLRFLIEKKDEVDDITNRKFNIFQSLKTKKKEINFNFSFSFIRDFFPNNKFDGKFDKYFLSILNSIFIDKKIEANFLMHRFMEKISQEFLNENWIEPWVLKSYKILLYLEKIKVLKRRKGMTKNYSNEFEEFFKENSIFDDDLKKALFLEGVLAQKLLNIQYNERKATPFRSRLNGLKIDEKIAKRLLPEIINKLEEYGKNYYSKLETVIGEYMLNADFKKYSIDEMSYFFTLGMVLEKHFRPETEQMDNIEE